MVNIQKRHFTFGDFPGNECPIETPVGGRMCLHRARVQLYFMPSMRGKNSRVDI